jgi:hypothetical protein
MSPDNDGRQADDCALSQGARSVFSRNRICDEAHDHVVGATMAGHGACCRQRNSLRMVHGDGLAVRSGRGQGTSRHALVAGPGPPVAVPVRVGNMEPAPVGVDLAGSMGRVCRDGSCPDDLAGPAPSVGRLACLQHLPAYPLFAGRTRGFSSGRSSLSADHARGFGLRKRFLGRGWTVIEFCCICTSPASPIPKQKQA